MCKESCSHKFCREVEEMKGTLSWCTGPLKQKGTKENFNIQQQLLLPSLINQTHSISKQFCNLKNHQKKEKLSVKSSEVIKDCNGFASLHCNWSVKFVPLSHPIRYKAKSIPHGPLHFLALSSLLVFTKSPYWFLLIFSFALSGHSNCFLQH